MFWQKSSFPLGKERNWHVGSENKHPWKFSTMLIISIIKEEMKFMLVNHQSAPFFFFFLFFIEKESIQGTTNRLYWKQTYMYLINASGMNKILKSHSGSSNWEKDIKHIVPAFFFPSVFLYKASFLCLCEPEASILFTTYSDFKSSILVILIWGCSH